MSFCLGLAFKHASYKVQKPFYSHSFPSLNFETNWSILKKLPEKSSILYLYTPLIIIFTANIVYFISTALEIRRIKYDVAKMSSEKESDRLRSNLNK